MRCSYLDSFGISQHLWYVSPSWEVVFRLRPPMTPLLHHKFSHFLNRNLFLIICLIEMIHMILLVRSQITIQDIPLGQVYSLLLMLFSLLVM